MSAPGPARRLGLPIAVQIIGLLLAVLVLGQSATFAIVTLFPPPRPPVYRIEDIAAALKDVRVAPRYAPPLIRSQSAEPPRYGRSADPRVEALQADLAKLLAVGPDDVRLRVEPRLFTFPFEGRPRRRGRFSGPPPPGPPPPAPPAAALQGDGPMEAGDMKGAAPWRQRRPWTAPWDRAALVVGQVDAAYLAAPGRWILVRSPPEGFPNAWQRRLLLWLFACLLVLTPIGYLFARGLTAPIRRFAYAADRLGRDPRSPPLAVTGPAELGLAAAAFNGMQARLALYVEDRTAMIAAIAHDLRTPLARVQFKLQRAPPDVARDIGSDLAQMEAMIGAVLAFVRDVAPAQERTRLDLLSLLEVVADDASGTGADVQLEPGPAAVVHGDASALQRLFVNLVDNAVKYGEQARISLAVEDGEAVVRVADSGPGVAEEDLERVFEPFHRLETSRSRDTGGIGLGLSVARSIARAHGGDVRLTSTPQGLCAEVRLPVDRAEA